VPVPVVKSYGSYGSGTTTLIDCVYLDPSEDIEHDDLPQHAVGMTLHLPREPVHQRILNIFQYYSDLQHTVVYKNEKTTDSG
jgi:hypothetical protein